MAVILPASIFDQIKGTIGQSVFQTSPYGQIVKTRPGRKGLPTIAQSRIQQNLAVGVALWRALTNAQRAAWAAAAPDFPSIDRFGNPFVPTGYNLFLRTLLIQGAARFSLITAPPTLVVDGSDWTVSYAGPAGQFRFTITENAGASTVSTQIFGTAPVNSSQTTARKRYELISRNDNRTTTGTVNYTTQYGQIHPAPVAGQSVFWRAIVYANLSPQILGEDSGVLHF